MVRSRLLAGLCGTWLTLHSGTGHAETVWDRARHPALVAEARILRSLYRTLSGTGDALDQMVARTAFVDLARGKAFERPSIPVLLLRLRRQLGLEPDPRSLQLLEPSSAEGNPRAIAAMSELEQAHVLLTWGRRMEAQRRLNRALALAWFVDLRSEILLLRGWLYMDARKLGEARADFLSILSMDVERRRLAVTLLSLACADEELGDLEQARVLWQRGEAVERSRAQASGASLFAGEGLHAEAVARLEGLSERLTIEASTETPPGEPEREQAEGEQHGGSPDPADR